MPVTKSAQKAMRRDLRRAKINLLLKKEYKKLLKKARQKPTRIALSQVSRSLDRATKKQIIHQNKAARLKSRLAKLVNNKVTKKTKKALSS